jgi:hypothetical protein
MREGFAKKAGICALISVACIGIMIGGAQLRAQDSPPDQGNPLTFILGLAGGLSWLAMFYFLVKGKGYTGFYAIVGLTAFPGLLLVMLLRDKYPDGAFEG